MLTSILKMWTSVLDAAMVKMLLCAVVVLMLMRWLTKKKYKLPPGPRPLPLLGNILSFRGTSLGSVISSWYKTYGPVVTFHVGPKRILLINSLEAMTEALQERGSDFSGRPYFYSLDKLTEGCKDIFFTTYGEAWKFQRKIAVQALRQFVSGTQLENRVQDVLQQVSESFKQKEIKAEPFNPHSDLSLILFNVIHGLCFGTTFQPSDPTFRKYLGLFDFIQQSSANGFIEDFFPPLRLWPSKTFREIMKGADDLNQYYHKQLAEHRENFSEDAETCIVDNIILAQQQAFAENDADVCAVFTDTHAAQIVADIFEAGVDTSRTTLDWILLVLVGKPEIQEKIHKELDAALGNKLPGRENRSKLVYTEAVMLEAMRLFPVAPYSVPHETIRDSVVGGYEIPAKTMTLINQLDILHDPEQWDDPLTFKPERFLDESGTKVVLRHKGWVPFSVGQRSCLGESLAKLNLLYILAGLLQTFKFSLPKNTEADFSPGILGLSGYAPKPYNVIISSR